MQRLRDPQWQSLHTAANGIAHIPWEPVLKSLSDLAEAADVLGRPDLAAALTARISPVLGRRHASVLEVLRRLARDPLVAPLPEFAPAAERTRQEIWDEAMREIQADLELAQYPASNSDDLDDSDDSDDFDDLDDFENLDGVGVSNRSPNSPQPSETGEAFEPLDPESDLELESQATKDLAGLGSAELNHAEFVCELMLALLGVEARRADAVRGLSQACLASVWADFDRHAAFVAALPSAQRTSARAEVAGWTPRSVLQLKAQTEQLVLRLRQLPARPDTRHVEQLLAGTASDTSHLHPLLKHPLLLRAGECAALAVRIHQTPLPPFRVAYCSAHQYSIAVLRAYVRNLALLMTGPLKDRVVAAWRELARVFLAQDPRTLMVLSELAGQSCASRAHADAILAAQWPLAPFRFDEHLNPVYTQELDSGLEAVLGAGLARLFPRERLTQCWQRVAAAFRDGDQVVELEMAALAAAVETRVHNAGFLDAMI